ncbi:cobyric acid synthase [Domibacillus aminovorans]|uniref:Cobyric acid synthase n=1 Tax=Domibacillus aminovorans TaxID=29332 RepID=A0A177L4H6_9BACI|nr:cobyric acid synthase [Domibacillus aminovorans]OAH60266.1 cobalamin biosynthesis protein CobQ [Domibacillus aminovorans]
MRGVMIQGTSSDAGKSFIATALCRLLIQKGYRPVPFKPQNVSNNSYVTADGKEIGRAQGLQAEAAGLEAKPCMNPLLLKPSGNGASEIVLFGERLEVMSGMAYRTDYYDRAIAAIKQGLQEVSELGDIVVIEGAGSPVEMNLKKQEVVNMKTAELADVPVILTADIDRGGLFASIVGTLTLLEEHERARVKGIIVNRFHGDARFFEDGKTWLEKYTGIPVLAVLPFLPGHTLDGEDSLSIRDIRRNNAAIDIAVIRLPYISNGSDIEPFAFEDDVNVRWVQSAHSFGSPDAVIIPGTKSAFADLAFLKETGLDERIVSFAKGGGVVTGLCGGFQLMGQTLSDPDGTDTGETGSIAYGMGIIPAHTIFKSEKTVVRTEGIARGIPLSGYEIHFGETKVCGEPFMVCTDYEEGYRSTDGKVSGTYLHHLFYNDLFRADWLNQIRRAKGLTERAPLDMNRDQTYDVIAEHLDRHLDWPMFEAILDGLPL